MRERRSKEVHRIEGRFLPVLEATAEDIRRAFPQVRTSTWSSPTGTLTDYQGHDLGIDCKLPDRPNDKVDNVALFIGVRQLTTTPALSEALVCWGHPSGTIEADLLVEGLPFSEETLLHIEAGLPKLFEALRRALERGKPIDE